MMLLKNKLFKDMLLVSLTLLFIVSISGIVSGEASLVPSSVVIGICLYVFARLKKVKKNIKIANKNQYSSQHKLAKVA